MSRRRQRAAPRPQRNDRAKKKAPFIAVAPKQVTVELSPRVKLPAMPELTMPPRVGRWLWTCRPDFEAQLFEELAWRDASPQLLGPALIESFGLKKGDPPMFARMGFPVSAIVSSVDEVHPVAPNKDTRFQAWTPDTAELNALTGEVRSFEDAMHYARREQGRGVPETPWAAYESDALLGQLCFFAPGQAAVGFVKARDAMSLAAGGRARQRRQGEAPSRASMKLDEALDWCGKAPGRGDVCVDLGSAPGGWTRRLVERGARVLSVDPGMLSEDLQKHPLVRHYQLSAFEFEPKQRAKWLFCDMAWRPLEVAQLLAKWARREWVTRVVANVKLPMNDKLPVLLRVRAILEDGGWKSVHIRQLYHDRDEVTLHAVR